MSTAVLDMVMPAPSEQETVVLVRGMQRNFLLQLAAQHAYATDSTTPRTRLFDQMQRAFPGALVDAPKRRTYDYETLDLNNGHVAQTPSPGRPTRSSPGTLGPGPGLRRSRESGGRNRGEAP